MALGDTDCLPAVYFYFFWLVEPVSPRFLGRRAECGGFECPILEGDGWRRAGLRELSSLPSMISGCGLSLSFARIRVAAAPTSCNDAGKTHAAVKWISLSTRDKWRKGKLTDRSSRSRAQRTPSSGPRRMRPTSCRRARSRSLPTLAARCVGRCLLDVWDHVSVLELMSVGSGDRERSRWVVRGVRLPLLPLSESLRRVH